ncbi:calcium-binding protein [Methylobacterium sp. E-045]|uniref:calcium-binding protein n=1 Tax=Methylobacterium sp. E-045 TaxID=2836575 RepID=UPI001FBB7FBE|nr:calcium-binding protein [Methylobacterium sp. E-045]MCJ2128400.1 calcium-binding protein [Methylobacterium sp. E-045]
MSAVLVANGEPIDVAPVIGTDSLDLIVPKGKAGFALLTSSYVPSPSGGAGTHPATLTSFGATGVPSKGPLSLGDLQVEALSYQSDGSTVIGVYDGTYVANKPGEFPFEIQKAKYSLGTVDAKGTFTPFYTTKITSLSDTDEPFLSAYDNSVAFAENGAMAVAHIAQGSTSKIRTVDLIDADHRFVATAVVDRAVNDDQTHSTRVTALSDGRYLATWVDTTRTVSTLMGRVVTADGKVPGDAFKLGQVKEFAGGYETKVTYSITADHDGGFAVAFEGRDVQKAAGGVQTDLLTDIQGATYKAGPGGSFKKAVDLVQDHAFDNAYVLSLTTLSNGQLLELVVGASDIADGKILTSARGLLYDADGSYTGQAFDFYSEAIGSGYRGGQPRIVALENGTFALIKSGYESGIARTDRDTDVQIYSVSTADPFHVKGATSGADLLKGAVASARNDRIDGLGGDDTLHGFAGSDHLIGGAGDDTLDGGKGIDRMEGGTGNDTFVVDHFGDVVIEKRGAGSDLVLSSIDHTLSAHVENLTLTGKGDIGGVGNALANTITGNAGNNRLDGGAGIDVLKGLGGDDDYYVSSKRDQVIEAKDRGTDTVYASSDFTLAKDQSIEFLIGSQEAPLLDIALTGNNLANAIAGTYGDNVINGGLGMDVLAGSGGRNTFVFDTKLGKDNIDSITDFVHGTDTIRLENAIFKGLVDGDLTGAAFKNVSTGTIDANDRVLYDQYTGALSYDADGNGAEQAVQFATVRSYGALTASDFLVS